jgi:CDGSH-type Zn-finger protein/uncharacterized Fe-S cluster protein YjdI
LRLGRVDVQQSHSLGDVPRRPAAHRTYKTDRIVVHWDSTRCIHTARCLNALPNVFDVGRRPWVDIEADNADAIGAAVRTCPTGALRYERLDDGSQDEPERPTVVVPIDNGPLLVMGDLRVVDDEGRTIAEEYRVTLCRCGRTRNQPFCDNSHLMAGFRSHDYKARPDAGEPPAADSADGKTTITATRDGSLHVEGRVVVTSQKGEKLADTDDVWLCRCGRSGDKPFCDRSHEGEFETRVVQVEPDRRRAETPAAFEPNRHVVPPPQVPE